MQLKGLVDLERTVFESEETMPVYSCCSVTLFIRNKHISWLHYDVNVPNSVKWLIFICSPDVPLRLYILGIYTFCLYVHGQILGTYWVFPFASGLVHILQCVCKVCFCLPEWVLFLSDPLVLHYQSIIKLLLLMHALLPYGLALELIHSPEPYYSTEQ